MELEDVDRHQCFEKGILERITQVVTLNVVADNKFTCNEGAEATGRYDSFIVYYDANNLYGYAMSRPLPYGEFRWMSLLEILDTSCKLESVRKTS